MKVNSKHILVGLLIVLLLLVLALFAFLIKNTALLTSVTPEDVNQNNSNNTDTDTDKPTISLTKLKSQTIIVPAKFKKDTFSETRKLNLPEGFQISLWSLGTKTPRNFDFTAGNNMVVAAGSSGTVSLIVNDADSDVSEEIIKIDSGLQNPHGIDYYNGDLYVGESSRIIVYRDLTELGKYSKKEVLISNIPTDGHSTRTVMVGPDKKLYVSIGSSCNLCEETDKTRAAIVRYNLDGTGEEIFASGLRNTVGFVFHQSEGNSQIWGVDNGRDNLGNDLPPEEVNIIEQGKNYGWPYCYGDRINNPEYPNKKDYCKSETEGPLYSMQAHSAPLGLTFVPTSNTTFPTALSANLFVTFHGSWNRTTPTGYKVVRIDAANTKSEPINFITGWLGEDGAPWGRPVGIGFDANGNMFIADDFSGAIYKVKYVAS